LSRSFLRARISPNAALFLRFWAPFRTWAPAPEHGHADDDRGGDGKLLPPLLDEADDPSETVDEFVFFEFFS